MVYLCVSEKCSSSLKITYVSFISFVTVIELSSSKSQKVSSNRTNSFLNPSKWDTSNVFCRFDLTLSCTFLLWTVNSSVLGKKWSFIRKYALEKFSNFLIWVWNMNEVHLKIVLLVFRQFHRQLIRDLLKELRMFSKWAFENYYDTKCT